jgi:hypothetical protein
MIPLSGFSERSTFAQLGKAAESWVFIAMQALSWENSAIPWEVWNFLPRAAMIDERAEVAQLVEQRFRKP